MICKWKNVFQVDINVGFDKNQEEVDDCLEILYLSL